MASATISANRRPDFDGPLAATASRQADRAVFAAAAETTRLWEEALGKELSIDDFESVNVYNVYTLSCTCAFANMCV